MRVVSLLASGTEIVYASGSGTPWPGVPTSATTRPRSWICPQVSRPGFPVSGASADVDLAVKDRLRKALSVYEVDEDLLRELEPDVLITQTQCRVVRGQPRRSAAIH